MGEDRGVRSDFDPRVSAPGIRHPPPGPAPGCGPATPGPRLATPGSDRGEGPPSDLRVLCLVYPVQMDAPAAGRYQRNWSAGFDAVQAAKVQLREYQKACRLIRQNLSRFSDIRNDLSLLENEAVLLERMSC